MSAPHDIAALETLPREALLALWAEVMRTPVPRQLSQPYLRRFLAFELQARKSGGLPAGFLARLAAAARAGGRAQARQLAPGARLLREWNGMTHVVEVTAEGYHWQGKRYRSLSVIARTITGAHWSGPRFFGVSEATAARTGAGGRSPARKARPS